MGTRDPRLDTYISRSAPFARPILRHLRAVVHAGCPQVEETIKWGMPFFVHNGILCHMAAFSQHVAFGFWRGRSLVAARHDRSDEAMGNFGRIGARSDLPPKRILIGYIRKAAALRGAKSATKAAPRPGTKRPETRIRRLGQAVEWLAQGKPRNWKHLKP
jgi:hypothetical protein